MNFFTCHGRTLLLLVIVAVIVPQTLWAQTWDCGVEPGMVTATLSEGTLTISGTGAMKDYTASSSAPWRRSFTEVVIVNGVTTIGNRAFESCSELTSVTIPNSVISIGDLAFSGCYRLPSVTIPNNVTYIGENAFSRCGLTSVSIPNSVLSIGYSAFGGCSSLTSVTIPNSVISIGRSAFVSCINLTSIDVAPSNTKYSSDDGVLFNKNKTILIQYPALKRGAYVIPNSVLIVEDFAFGNCEGLTSVTIPNGVTSIGSGAFGDCTRLTSVTIPNNVDSVGYGAFSGCVRLTSVTIGNSVTSIGAGAFSGCENLISVIIPNSVITIRYSAFTDCIRLTSVTIGNSVSTIERYAFSGCIRLTSVTIGNSVSTIEGDAFSGCIRLTSVTVGNSVSTIEGGAFSGCENLTSVTILNVVPPTIGNDTFRGINLNACLYVPEGSIGVYTEAKYYWENFNSINAVVSVASYDRVVRQINSIETMLVVPVSQLTAEFTVGPNPVDKSKSLDAVNFFRHGALIKSALLHVYDASGNVIRKIAISDKAAIGNNSKRSVGSWDLRDAKGRQVSEGTYLVKGVLKTVGGKRESVSVVVGVR